ncbi:MAG: metal ABC transporter ATP-binding protein [Chloroflexi bacterium]|nr:metal ABC transporter ATP-binding protein [Chloroflexota bacterium]
MFPWLRRATSTLDIPPDVPAIEVRDVYVSYNGHPVLQGVSLTVPQGSFWALLGPNGAGKTTLLKVIVGLIKPQRGTVRVFGRPPEALGPWRRALGYVPQHQRVDLYFPIRVKDVVMMGRYGMLGFFRRPGPEDWRAVDEALERVGIPHLRERPLHALSGGERQRVFLARALVTQPKLLLLDEPTAGVDVAATQSLYELLRDLHKSGMTVVMVSHDVGVVTQFVDSVACLNRRLVAHGRPEVVLTADTLSDMYGCEAVFFHHAATPHLVVRRHPPEDAS